MQKCEYTYCIKTHVCAFRKAFCAKVTTALLCMNVSEWVREHCGAISDITAESIAQPNPPPCAAWLNLCAVNHCCRHRPRIIYLYFSNGTQQSESVTDLLRPERSPWNTRICGLAIALCIPFYKKNQKGISEKRNDYYHYLIVSFFSCLLRFENQQNKNTKITL